MDIYVYSDESGVFDRDHNDIFVYGGLLFLSKNDKDEFSRKYAHAETVLRQSGNYNNFLELKASTITNKEKGKLFRSTNQCLRFGIVIHQKRLLHSIFNNKRDKQRYLDYAFKIGLKRYLVRLINVNRIDPNNIGDIRVYVDEHSTATNGRYELEDALLHEFKYGTHNDNWNTFFQPLFPDMGNVSVEFCDSSQRRLIRTADIIANRVYHSALENKLNDLNMFIIHLP